MTMKRNSRTERRRAAYEAALHGEDAPHSSIAPSEPPPVVPGERRFTVIEGGGQKPSPRPPGDDLPPIAA